MDAASTKVRQLLIAALQRARETVTTAVVAPIRVAVVRAGDLIALSSGLGCDDLPLQVSSGRLAADIIRLEVAGLSLGYAFCDRDIIFEESGLWPTANLDGDQGTLKLEIAHRGLIRRPARSPAWCLSVASWHCDDEEAGWSLGRHSSDAAFWAATTAILAAVAAQTGGNTETASVEVRASDLVTLIDTFGSRLAGCRAMPASRGDQVVLELLRLAQREHNHRIEHLVADLNMTRRNLHYCSTGRIGVSPKRLVKSMALRDVMMAMPAAATSGATIGDLAFQHGFESLPRFSADYRMLFGERPSDTMRRYRSA